MARLKKDLREKDNVIEEKLEELEELSDRVELLETVSLQGLIQRFGALEEFILLLLFALSNLAIIKKWQSKITDS